MLSVIVPCYDEQEVLAACHTRLSAVLAGLGMDYEVVYVNDGSRDHTYSILESLHREDRHVVVASLSRNFGHQKAVSAGLSLAQGEAAVILDADLQDPPEVIPSMVEKWRAGYQVVYGVRVERAAESNFKVWSAKFFYRLIHRIANIDIPVDTGDFRLVDRAVIDALLAMPERHRLLRAMCSWVGFQQTGVAYQRQARFAGKTKYPLFKMVQLALDGIVSFSILPLHALTLIGIGAAALSFVGVIYAFIVRIFTSHWVAGWATLFIGMLFLSGLQMISLGVMGEYLGRIYEEVKQRPLYVLSSVLRTNSVASASGKQPSR